MERMKKFVLLALMFNLPMLILSFGLLWGCGLENMFYLAVTTGALTWLALPLLILGLAVKRTNFSRVFGRLGLLVFAFALLGQIGSYYYKYNGVWQPEYYRSIAEQRNDVVKVIVGRSALEVGREDWPQVLDLMQQVNVRNPSYWIKKPTDLLPEANTDCHFLVYFSDGSMKDITLYPPYYFMGHENAFRAGDVEVCRQLADLYEELSVKYAASDLGLAAAD